MSMKKKSLVQQKPLLVYRNKFFNSKKKALEFMAKHTGATLMEYSSKSIRQHRRYICELAMKGKDALYGELYPYCVCWDEVVR